MIKQLFSYIKFIKLAKSVGFNLENPHPIEALAFQTVASIKLAPNKNLPILKYNELTTYDTIIFTLFIVRMLCVTQITNRTNAEQFSDFYINKVFEFFPENKRISSKYDNDFFAERVKYYDSVIEGLDSFDDCIAKVIDAFQSIIKYDYEQEYIRFSKDTPLILVSFDVRFKISLETKMFYNTLPNFFSKLLPDVLNLYK